MDVKTLARGKLDVAKWLADNGIEVYRVKRLPDGRTAWTLKECPFNDAHRDGDAAVMQAADGTLSARCFHAGCAGQGWAAFRQRIGPIRPGAHVRQPGPGASPVAAADDGYDLEWVSNAELFADQTEVRFLVDNVLAAEQPCILGGAGKTLKTSLAVDLAISLASGDPWLGRFAVPQPGPVLFISAESGKPVLRDVMRAVCWAKHVDARDLPIQWSFRRPLLTQASHLASLLDAIEEHRPKLVILDPTYLLLMGGGDSERTKNLFAMGSVLGTLSDAVSQSGATMLLLHHVTKSIGRSKREPIALGDLAYAGFSEWARQWILVSRWEDYTPGTGEHALHVSVGGSAGHSGAWVARVNEGRPTDPLIGRLWQVDLEAPGQPTGRKVEQGNDARVALAILRSEPNGMTVTELREAGGWSGTTAKKLIEELTAAFHLRTETVGSKTVYFAMGDEL